MSGKIEKKKEVELTERKNTVKAYDFDAWDSRGGSSVNPAIF